MAGVKGRFVIEDFLRAGEILSINSLRRFQEMMKWHWLH